MSNNIAKHKPLPLIRTKKIVSNVTKLLGTLNLVVNRFLIGK